MKTNNPIFRGLRLDKDMEDDRFSVSLYGHLKAFHIREEETFMDPRSWMKEICRPVPGPSAR